MVFASLGPFGGPLLGALLGLLWGLLGVLEASWASLPALVASQVRLGSHLGHLGRLGERQGRVWALTEPREEAAMHATRCDSEGGPLEYYRNPTRQYLAF